MRKVYDAGNRNMAERVRALIVFTDLDGTLLDHATYSYAPAEPALGFLRAAQIPLILASSKTAAEIAPLRAQLGFQHCPAIVENGAGILPPGQTNGAVGRLYATLLDDLDTIDDTLRPLFHGFDDLGVDGIVEATGLPPENAQLAAQRAFSEPGIWHGDEQQLEQFISQLQMRGIVARSGGRFMTLSYGGTKAAQMEPVIEMLFGDATPFVIALGDAPNDVEMLEKGDRGFIIANDHGKPIPPLNGERDGRISRTEKSGPAGWNEAVLSIV